MTPDGTFGRDPDYTGDSTQHVAAELFEPVRRVLGFIPHGARIFCLGNAISDVRIPKLREVFTPNSTWRTVVQILMETANAVVFVSPMSGKGVELELFERTMWGIK